MNRIKMLGYIGVGGQKGRVYSANGISPIVLASTWKDPIKFIDRLEKTKDMANKNMKYCIRKLTPTTCWKLMGWEETDVLKARKVAVSDTQLYKQAGNGLVTNCAELLMEHLYKAQYDNTYKCTDENFIRPQLD